MNKANVRIELDASCEIPEVIIRTSEKTPLVENIEYAVKKVTETASPFIRGNKDHLMSLIPQAEIVRVYTEKRKVIIRTVNQEYESGGTLQELERALNDDHFVRISRFEIVNLERVESFDFSVSGTIKVNFENGSSTWVSRRQVREIQERLARLQKERRGTV